MGKVMVDKLARTGLSEGKHLEVAIHTPRLPFGAVNAENLTPIFQTDVDKLQK